MAHFYKLTVSEIRPLTPNAVAVSLKVPQALKATFAFTAGQYITIKHTLNGTELRRAYSLCTAPGSGVLQVGVKKVKGGAFSVFANERLKKGDVLQVMPPQGKFNFTPTPNAANAYVAFVAGSGITPVLSIIKTALAQEPNSTFTVVYGNRSIAETMFFDELARLKQANPRSLQVQYIYSRAEPENGMFGRIDRATVNYLLKSKLKAYNFTAHYLCGPGPMIATVKSILKERGVNEEQIHTELFTTAQEAMPVQPHGGSTQLTITVDDGTRTFTAPQTQSVLEAALQHKIDVPYSCQGGICSTCIARIVEGRAEMQKNQILTDGEIAEGLILTCQAHPTTPTLIIDYDDV
ncbi:MAG: 2Fe-2S iron-sulfur cluster-binding protein [Marinirhabdus sp.]